MFCNNEQCIGQMLVHLFLFAKSSTVLPSEVVTASASSCACLWKVRPTSRERQLHHIGWRAQNMRCHVEFTFLQGSAQCRLCSTSLLDWLFGHTLCFCSAMPQQKIIPRVCCSAFSCLRTPPFLKQCARAYR